MKVLPYSEFRASMKASLDAVCSDHEPTIVTRPGEPVVILSLEDYNIRVQAIHVIDETTYLMSGENGKRLLESMSQLKELGVETPDVIVINPGLPTEAEYDPDKLVFKTTFIGQDNVTDTGIAALAQEVGHAIDAVYTKIIWSVGNNDRTGRSILTDRLVTFLREHCRHDLTRTPLLDAFQVVCDESNNTPSLIDSGESPAACVYFDIKGKHYRHEASVITSGD